MKAALKKHDIARIWHYVDGKHVEGAPSGVWGDLSDVWGDLSGVRGNLSGVGGDLSDVWGDLGGVRGNLSGVVGDLSGVRGDLDACELTDTDRERGVHISELIERESAGVTK